MGGHYYGTPARATCEGGSGRGQHRVAGAVLEMAGKVDTRRVTSRCEVDRSARRRRPLHKKKARIQIRNVKNRALAVWTAVVTKANFVSLATHLRYLTGRVSDARPPYFTIWQQRSG